MTMDQLEWIAGVGARGFQGDKILLGAPHKILKFADIAYFRGRTLMFRRRCMGFVFFYQGYFMVERHVLDVVQSIHN